LQLLLNASITIALDASTYPRRSQFSHNLASQWGSGQTTSSHQTQFCIRTRAPFLPGMARPRGRSFGSSLYLVEPVVGAERREHTASINDQVAPRHGGNFLGEPMFAWPACLRVGPDSGPAGAGVGGQRSCPPHRVQRFAYGQRFAGGTYSAAGSAVFTGLPWAAPCGHEFHVQRNSTLKPSGADRTARRSTAAEQRRSHRYGLPGKPGQVVPRPFEYSI